MVASEATADEESPGCKNLNMYKQKAPLWANPRWLDVYIAAVGIMTFLSTSTVMETVRFVMAVVTVEYKDLSSFTVGWVGSAIPAGALIGVLGGGLLADSFGRRTIIMIGQCLLMLSCSGIFLDSTVPAIGLFISVHFMKGISYGSIIVCTLPWIIERCGTRERGILVAVTNLGWVTGGLLVLLLIKLKLFETIPSLELLPIPAALLALMAISTAAESRQWQCSVAERDKRTIAAGLLEMPQRLLLTLAVFWFTMPGVSYAIFFWAPTLLREHSGETEIDLVTLGLAILTGLPVALTAGWLIDYGRRSIVASSMVISMMLLLIMPYTSTAGWKVCYIALECFIGVAWTIGSIWTNELFPTRVRATAYGAMQCCARVSAMCGPVLAGAARDLSSNSLYHLCGALAVISVCAVMLLDETAKSLPQLD